MDFENANRLSRRCFLCTAAAAGAAGWVLPRGLLARPSSSLSGASYETGIVQAIRQAAASEPMSVQSLRGGVSVVMGSGGNIVVLPGPDGTLLIDGGIVGARVAASVATISESPIRHLINTHWHFDHTDANDWMHHNGAAIVAHENTRKHLMRKTRVEDWNFTFQASPSGALPGTVFATTHSLELNGTTVALEHYGPAHTDSDISVHLVNSDVFHVGDTWWNGLYPFIDYSTGGSIDGTILATESNLRRVTPGTIIVPGHGPVGDTAQLAKYRDMLVAVRDRVADLKKQGRPVGDVIAAKPTAAFDSVWGGSIINPATFTGLVYKGV